MTEGRLAGFPREDVVGLDIGDGVLAATHVVTRGKGAELREAAWAEYDTDAGERHLVQAIRRLWRDAAFPTNSVCSCLRSRSLAIKYFHYPVMSSRELGSALRLEAEEALQLSQDQIALDWFMNRRTEESVTEEGEKEIEGVLVAAPREVVDGHLRVLRSAGLFPLAVDVACMSIANAYVAQGKREGDDKVECVISLARRNVDIAILFDGTCVYPRSLMGRSASWNDATDYLLANIKDVLKFYQFKLRQEPVQKLVFCGQVPAVEAFLGKVRDMIGLPVEYWDPIADMTHGLSRKSRARASRAGGISPLVATSLGLGIRES